jgi:NADPH-dependent curcumin reductase CurA
LLSLHGMDPSTTPIAAVRSGGKVAGVAAVPDEATLAAAGLTGTSVMAAATRDVLAPLAQQAADGTLQVAVADVLTLDQAPEGLGRLATGGAGGKLVVTVQD